jgi:hypothetical protein
MKSTPRRTFSSVAGSGASASTSELPENNMTLKVSVGRSPVSRLRISCWVTFSGKPCIEPDTSTMKT